MEKPIMVPLPATSAFVFSAQPALILLIGYMTRGIFPVGNRTLTIDLYHQYAPLSRRQQADQCGAYLPWAG